MDEERASKGVVAMADRPFESTDPPSILDGLNQFTGVVVLVTLMVGFDLYRWLGLHQPPRLSVLWLPAIAVNMVRRMVSGDDAGPWPAPWYAALAAYSGVILAIVLVKGIHASDDWWMAGFAALWIAIGVWKAARREAVR
jgi:hypothetical protein